LQLLDDWGVQAEQKPAVVKRILRRVSGEPFTSVIKFCFRKSEIQHDPIGPARRPVKLLEFLKGIRNLQSGGPEAGEFVANSTQIT
jgi:hypothetical protein